MNQAWAYPSGSAINTSPSINDDVAYFGNDAGTLTALDVQNSEPLWTYSAGTAIDSSPAIGSGLVIFGAGDAVDAVSQSTGALVWQTSTSSPVVSSPSVSGGLVYVGSNDGTLYALHTTDGSMAWKAPLAGAVTDSPSVDAASAEVVVGDASGAVTAFNAASRRLRVGYCNRRTCDSDTEHLRRHRVRGFGKRNRLRPQRSDRRQRMDLLGGVKRERQRCHRRRTHARFVRRRRHQR